MIFVVGEVLMRWSVVCVSAGAAGDDEDEDRNVHSS